MTDPTTREALIKKIENKLITSYKAMGMRLNMRDELDFLTKNILALLDAEIAAGQHDILNEVIKELFVPIKEGETTKGFIMRHKDPHEIVDVFRVRMEALEAKANPKEAEDD